MKKSLDRSLLEDVFLYLAKYELYKPQLVLAALKDQLGYTREMMAILLAYLGKDEDEIRREGEEIKKSLEAGGLSYFSILDKVYPPLLKHIVQAPLILFYRGNLRALKQKCLSIVGTRKPSFDGIRACDVVIANLAKYFKHISIVSGLALGVDSLVHRASLKYGLSAISVLPSSVIAPTPTTNIHLANQILDSGGLLLSEKFPGHSIRSHSYIERNRIISGLSTKTLIVEAALRSGSMSTARLAIEQGRDVYAMPGSLSNPVAEGCNYLISMGAYPLYKLDALLDDGEFKVEDREEASEGGISALSLCYSDDGLLAFIRKNRRLGLEYLGSKFNMAGAELLSKLVEYELEGLIAREGDEIIAL